MTAPLTILSNWQGSGRQKIGLISDIIKKENEGKTRAVKLGFDKEPRGEYTLILDSDDYLSDNAIEIIINNVSCLGPKFIGILGLKAFTNGEIVGQKIL